MIHDLGTNDTRSQSMDPRSLSDTFRCTRFRERFIREGGMCVVQVRANLFPTGFNKNVVIETDNGDLAM